VVIAVIGILAALLLPVLSGAKAKAKRLACMNNLKQINLGVVMYTGDNSDNLPRTRTNVFHYKDLLKNYVGPADAGDPLFICPAEQYDSVVGLPSKEPHFNFSDYSYNSRSGHKASGIRHPAVTILVAELPAFVGFSWHRPQSGAILITNSTLFTNVQGLGFTLPGANNAYNNAMNVVSFADGHISYIKIYNDELGISVLYEPPPGYDYQWSGD
jgi:type II secretory pathway pseudopilin PulG